MTRRLAFFVYVVGTLASLSALVSGLKEGLLHGAVGAVWAVAIWWITAGIGIRLGVFPVEFFTSVYKSLGLGYDAPVEGATRIPERPHGNHDRS